MDIEEAKKICENLIKNYKLPKTNTYYNKVAHYIYDDKLEAIETVLTELEKKDRTKKIATDKIEKLLNGIKDDFPIILGEQQPLWKENETHYIHKDKIKSKIEEYKERIEKMHPASDCVIIEDLETKIECLEELLKSEE